MLNITHVQRSEVVADVRFGASLHSQFVRERNRAYQRESGATWDLRCSAVYASDFLSSLQRSFPAAPERSHGPGIPRQCPAKNDMRVLMDPSVFEDYVFYARDNATLRSRRNPLWMKNLVGAMKQSMGEVEPGSTIQIAVDPKEMDGFDSNQRIVISGENALEELVKLLAKMREGNGNEHEE